VLSASVTVDKQLISSIGKGTLVFAAVAPGDTQKDAEKLATKVLKLKLWNADDGARVGIIGCFLVQMTQRDMPPC
jgi:D-tyrosyl-tRNA(Tyr) deacylase